MTYKEVWDWVKANYIEYDTIFTLPAGNKKKFDKELKDFYNEIKCNSGFEDAMASNINQSKLTELIEKNNEAWIKDKLGEVDKTWTPEELKEMLDLINTEGKEKYEDESVKKVVDEVNNKIDEVSNEIIKEAKRWIPSKNYPTYDTSSIKDAKVRAKVEEIVSASEVESLGEQFERETSSRIRRASSESDLDKIDLSKSVTYEQKKRFSKALEKKREDIRSKQRQEE
jgi:uncharacterized membrane protein